MLMVGCITQIVLVSYKWYERSFSFGFVLCIYMVYNQQIKNTPELSYVLERILQAQGQVRPIQAHTAKLQNIRT